MHLFLERVTIFCIAASYGVALTLELMRSVRPKWEVRVLAQLFGAAGLLAHTIFLVMNHLPLAKPWGSMLFLAWILAVFYLYGSLHHGRLAWGLFVLPLVLGLIVLAWFFYNRDAGPSTGVLDELFSFEPKKFWGIVHGIVLLLAGVGVSVGFVASVMYLVQVHRLKAKVAPSHGVKMMSLERIETMNRRAVLWAFPLLTAGLLVGVALQVHTGDILDGWTTPKILSGLGLWVVFAILLYLRYAAHIRGRQIAWWTMLAFGLLVLALMSPVHPFVQGGGP